MSQGSTLAFDIWQHDKQALFGLYTKTRSFPMDQGGWLTAGRESSAVGWFCGIFSGFPVYWSTFRKNFRNDSGYQCSAVQCSGWADSESQLKIASRKLYKGSLQFIMFMIRRAKENFGKPLEKKSCSISFTVKTILFNHCEISEGYCVSKLELLY